MALLDIEKFILARIRATPTIFHDRLFVFQCLPYNTILPFVYARALFSHGFLLGYCILSLVWGSLVLRVSIGWELLSGDYFGKILLARIYGVPHFYSMHERDSNQGVLLLAFSWFLCLCKESLDLWYNFLRASLRILFIVWGFIMRIPCYCLCCEEASRQRWRVWRLSWCNGCGVFVYIPNRIEVSFQLFFFLFPHFAV